MSYRIRAVDANQPEIVKAARSVGAFVIILSTLGHGVPDILVVFRGQYWLMELKVGKEGLTDDEKKFAASCPVPVHIIRSKEDLFILIGATPYNLTP